MTRSAAVLVCLALGVVGCSGPSDAGAVSVGIAYATGGKRDESYNQSAALGAELARRSFGTIIREVEPAQFGDMEPALVGLSQAGVRLVIAVGPFYPDSVKRVSERFPGVNFVVIDGEVQQRPNVRSILFREEQGSYLVGALGGLATKSHRVGAVLAIDIPVLNKFYSGFRCGVLKTNAQATVEKAVIGASPAAFSDPLRGAETARYMLGRGFDVIYQVAGASGRGVINAVRDSTGGLAIGVDSNQNGLAPGKVLTSMLKRVDLAVLDSIGQMSKGSFSAEVVRLGIDRGGSAANDYVNYQMDSNNEGLVRPEWRARVDGLREEIRSGRIVVPENLDGQCM